MPKFPKGIKIYRKFRYRKGHGVHSPFVYNLITKVIEEKTPYYVFEEIEGLQRKVSQNFQSQKYGPLLFRLINFFQCKSVVQVGEPTGITTLYLGFARSSCMCSVLEENEESNRLTKEVVAQSSLKNIRIETGNYLTRIKSLSDKMPKIDLIFINVPHHEAVSEIVQECMKLVSENTILVIDGIRRNNRMKKVWKELVDNSQVGVSMDLYNLGLIFFKENIHKKHYKAYFDHGKEQNLYQNRRQRFHFFSGRKKSFQDKYTVRSLWNRG